MTGAADKLDDLEVAEQLAATCYALYQRVPAGLAPEIAFFVPPRVPWPKAHSPDVGDGDFYVKPLVSPLNFAASCAFTWTAFCNMS